MIFPLGLAKCIKRRLRSSLNLYYQPSIYQAVFGEGHNMGFFSSLFGGGGSSDKKERLRHKGRYGQPGAFRKERNGDKVSRGSDGKYKK